MTLAEGIYLLKIPRPFAPPGDENNSTGPEPSELLDAGQWMQVADRAATAVPTKPVEAGRVLAVAQAAVDEVIKFVPAGQDAVPEDEFWTPEGRAVRDAEPGRFRLDRLLVVRDTYRDLVRETGAR